MATDHQTDRQRNCREAVRTRGDYIGMSDGILIVHVDNPTRETIERRTLAFVADTFFDRRLRSVRQREKTRVCDPAGVVGT